MRTVVDGLLEGARGGGTLTVLSDADGGQLRWAQVHERARRMATVLAAYGVKRGSRVGLLADTGLSLVTAIQAVWLAGASITVLPPPSGSRWNTILPIIADADLDLVVTDREPQALPRGVRLQELAQASTAAEPAEIVAVGPDDLAVLQYTSGSTSDPRGVPVRHRHLAANLQASKAALGHDQWHGGPMMSWLPLYHDMGLIGFLALPMSCGCSLVLQPPAAFARRPLSWPEALSRFPGAVTGAPNFAYRLMASLLDTGPAIDLSRVRMMLCGGEPIDPAAMDTFTRLAGAHGLRPHAVVPAYGLAEATLAVTLATAGVSIDMAGGKAWVRLGRPIPGTEIRITGQHTGEPLAERDVGRIEVRGPGVAAVNGWLDTGDLGYLTEGELVVCGREKDVLFAAGRNIYPQDVEAAAGRVPGVRFGSPVAFGVPGDLDDRLIVAVEATGTETVRLRNAVAAAVVEQTGLRPAEIVLLPPGRSPKTSSGKPRRAEARRRYLHGVLTPEKGRSR